MTRTCNVRLIDARDAGDLSKATEIAWWGIHTEPHFQQCCDFLVERMAAGADLKGLTLLGEHIMRRCEDVDAALIAGYLMCVQEGISRTRELLPILKLIQSRPGLSLAELYATFNVYQNKQAKLASQRHLPASERSSEYVPKRKFDRVLLPAISASVIRVGADDTVTVADADNRNYRPIGHPPYNPQAAVAEAETVVAAITAIDNFAVYPRAIVTRIVGVRYANRDGSDRFAASQRCHRGEPVRLVREPHNSEDPYAVAVFRRSGEQLGYLARSIVGEGWWLARSIDDGHAFDVRVSSTEPDIWIKIQRTNNANTNASRPVERIRRPEAAPDARSGCLSQGILVIGVASGTVTLMLKFVL